ncbi:alpha-amylase family glycosyl hydrolase [Halapricum hydrolyticum]|uniref:Alpha-amylase family glycosyl hydrolase n=1 Tax=Halapricum hydrolyticum TaxID=2979991 RepID=A0AAE3LFB7_9EURY|nr:alpha-amylase family glycosyl hydrolase [Halapricum hydrolyticum]MCU4718539.1 alpha-amylase family glycosyl hydrolase [Halapricum hydrolyticum]MCU4727442.1 alpha-amylase family glycosyl hydrolase [Halapricum hydrolyticum]
MAEEFDPETPVESHHPGPPRFVTVGEPILDPVFVIDADTTSLGVDVEIDATDHGRDNLAPRLPELSVTPTEPDDFEWSVSAVPEDSDGEVLSFATSTTVIPRYDPGHDTVAEFEADVPGCYRLALDAPDGTHDLTIHAFPECDPDANPPRIELEGTYDESAEAFHVESNARLAPASDADRSDLAVTLLADDRDALSTGDIDVGDDGTTATISREALDGETGRVHAAAYDGRAASTQDVLELQPDGTVTTPNRPPVWLENAVIYEIFPRSWAGKRGATTFETLIEGDPATGARGVAYLDELGVDAVWLTPVVPATSAGVDGAPGGPHGYGTLDYMGIAEDLVPEEYDDPVAAYADFVEACNERDIKVVFDLVINHVGRGIDLFQETIAREGAPADDGRLSLPTVESWDRDASTFDWFDRVGVARYAEDGTVFETEPRPTGFGDSRTMPKFDYETLQLREYVLSVADFWAREVGVDGFRCDVAFGVPHSFWMEVREIVRDADAEFLMLDETVPNDRAYAASQFDLHFDTYGFTHTAQDVATLDPDARADPEQLVEDVLSRRDQGHPEFTRLLNAIENHDELRLLNQIVIDPADPCRRHVTDDQWERAMALQRACFAASITLPGVPLIYYGQERAISRYGEGRHRGEDDDRGLRDGEIHPQSDVRPGGRQRALMNWAEYDADHLDFYQNMIRCYHDVDVLGPDGDLRPIEVDDDLVVAFVRETETADSDPERVLVVLNFGDTAIDITAPPSVAEIDLVTGESTRDGGRTLTVETVGVFAATKPVDGDLELRPHLETAISSNSRDGRD